MNTLYYGDNLKILRDHIKDGSTWLGYLITLILIVLTISGCDAQVRKNIERLTSAQARLEANPNDEEALSTILKLLNDRNGINRANAAAVLGHAAERVGGSIKDKALPPLIRLLDDGDAYDKRAAAKGISGFGVHAAAANPVLRKSLFPSDTDAARYSALALGKIGEPAAIAVPDLLKVVEERSVDPEPLQIREVATRSIGQIGRLAAGAAPRLMTLLGQASDPQFQIALEVAVIRIDPGNDKAVNAMERSMRSFDADDRRRLMYEMEDAGSESKPALRVIKAARNDEDENVRNAANRLLKVIEN